MSKSQINIKNVRVFLNYVDLYQNNAIAQYLLHDLIESPVLYEISGTIYDHEGFGVAEFKKKLTECLFKSLSDIVDRIIEHDFIIYDIGPDSDEINEIEKILNAFEKLYQNDTENQLPIKYFILISTPLTWGATEARNKDGILHETEYRRRRAHPSYLRHKHIERLVNLFEKKVNGKVRTLIICPGYTFGGTNDTFHYIFKLAFFNKQKVPIIEPGHQVIPLIYINDFAKIVVNIIEEFPPPEQRYIFAVQPNFWPIKGFTRNIVSSLTGNVTRVAIMPKNCLFKYADEVFPQRVIDAITTPLKFAPKYLKDFKYTFNKPEEIGQILAEEYRYDRNLSPIKILIDGPPLVGKTTIARNLAEYYNLNYIEPSNAIDLVVSRLQKDITAGQKLLLNLEKEKLESGNEDDEELQKIEHNTKVLIEEWQECVVELINHITNEEKDKNEVLKYEMKCLKDILSSKLYSENQGYIIDGFPFTYEQAAEILFASNSNVGEEEKKENEANHEEEYMDESFKKFAFSHLMPNAVILLDAADELIWQRGMQLPLDEALRTGNNEEGVCNRLDEFRKRDEHEDTTLTTFFFDNNIMPLTINISDDIKYTNLLEMIKEKIGPPHTYPLTPLEKKKLKNAEMENALRAEKEFQRKQKEIANKVRAEREAKLKQWTNDFEALKREEELSAEAKTLPLRQYLSKFVLPTLTEGILEVTRIKPDDPVDFLAEYLFKHNTTGHVLSDSHTEEMKRLLLNEGTESVLSTIDNYVLNENQFKCSDLWNHSNDSRK